MRATAVVAWIALWGCGPEHGETAEAPEPSESRAAEPTPEAGLALTVSVVDAAGAPQRGVVVGWRGGYDTRPRALGTTSDVGEWAVRLEEPGVVFLTVGPEARELLTYGTPAGERTLAMYVERPGSVQVRVGSEGALEASGELEVWPVHEASVRGTAMVDALVAVAREHGPESGELDALVDRQWAEILAESDARHRALLLIHYVTYVSQAVGPDRFRDILELVPPDDRAWAFQSTRLLELVWVLGDDAWRGRLMESLRAHHDDPGLEAALLSWELSEAAKAGDEARTLELYRRLEKPRYAPTVAWRSARRHDPERGLEVGKPIPGFALERTDETGGSFTEADLVSKAWLVQVWATWCKPCRAELDALPPLYARLGDRRDRVDFLAISVDADRELATTTLASHDVAWPSVWAPKREELMEAWGFAGVPLTVLVDDQGRVARIWEGATSLRSIETAIDELLGAP